MAGGYGNAAGGGADIIGGYITKAGWHIACAGLPSCFRDIVEVLALNCSCSSLRWHVSRYHAASAQMSPSTLKFSKCKKYCKVVFRATRFLSRRQGEMI